MRSTTAKILVLVLASFLGQFCPGTADGQWLFLRSMPDNYLRLKDGGFNPYKGPKPLVVFLQTDPWELVIGTETPVVVFYDDHDLIFVKRTPKAASYHHKRLSEAEAKDFLKHVSPVYEVKELKRSYDLAPNTTDMPEARFLFHKDGGDLTTEVRGLMLPKTSLPAYTRFPSKTQPDKPPAELFAIHKFLATIDYKGSVPWTPEYVEVMLYPWGDHAPETGVDWPKDWPGLQSERALQGRDLVNRDVFYSVFLDAKLLPEVRKLLTEKVDAVNLGGRKWMFNFRYVFPNEPTWRRPFNQAEIELFRKHDSP
jgi:hypothetical protein